MNNESDKSTEQGKRSNAQPELTHYIELLQNHKEYLTSAREWNEYRKENNLPHSQTLIKKFGSWNAVKESIGTERVNERHRPVKYNKETVINILKEHGRHLTTKLDWDKYAKEHKLPNYTVLFKRLSDEEIYDLTGYRRVFSKELLVQIIKDYYPTTPPTIREWRELAKIEKSAPSASLIIVHFGSWKGMIESIYEK